VWLKTLWKASAARPPSGGMKDVSFLRTFSAKRKTERRALRFDDDHHHRCAVVFQSKNLALQNVAYRICNVNNYSILIRISKAHFFVSINKWCLQSICYHFCPPSLTETLMTGNLLQKLLMAKAFNNNLN
jgi:hypothetical protein